jgi:3',5'-cyclic AMP phosphodiesterase CpdA
VLRILHISDVHFGPPHLKDLSEAVLELEQDRRPDLVVISGDLTQRAKPHQFQQARRFVDRFEAPTLVVPGNHDVPLYRFWERLFAPFGAYRKHFHPELEPVVESDEFVAIGVNTAHGWTFTEGRIRSRRLREVAGLLDSVPNSTPKIVVAHHNLVPPPRFGRQKRVWNAAEAMELFSGAGVDLILSGHNHQAFVAESSDFYPDGRPPVLILHSGTTTSDRGRWSEEGKNSCFWIEIGTREVTISLLRWEPAPGRFAEHAHYCCPRRERSPYTLEEAVRSETEGHG